MQVVKPKQNQWSASGFCCCCRLAIHDPACALCNMSHNRFFEQKISYCFVTGREFPLICYETNWIFISAVFFVCSTAHQDNAKISRSLNWNEKYNHHIVALHAVIVSYFISQHAHRIFIYYIDCYSELNLYWSINKNVFVDDCWRLSPCGTICACLRLITIALVMFNVTSKFPGTLRAVENRKFFDENAIILHLPDNVGDKSNYHGLLTRKVKMEFSWVSLSITFIRVACKCETDVLIG